MGNNPVNERDLVLDPSTFAYVQDRSQGEIGIYVGPFRVGLNETDQPVTFDQKSKRFMPTSLEQAIQRRVVAPEGWYVVMKNPVFVKGGDDLRFPETGTKHTSKEASLTVGRKINIPGPCDFALWPGQMTSTVKGHHLRSNQYLLVRVYDEEAALKNRGDAVIKSAEGTDDEVRSLIPEDLPVGKLFIIKGTDASFFIPPTGIEVVKDENGEYIRDAETLEVLEYCILLDENGNKRLPRGPAVVFPEPTETFVTKQGHRKFTAFELNEKSGLYIKIIKAYTDENGVKHEVGEELFITGADTPVYFPREEHAIIKYGDNKKIQYAVAIPSGEGRYVLNRQTGEISTVTGPAMLLPDPRHEVLVRKILKSKEVELMYPGNIEAAQVNEQLNLVREANQGYALMASAVSEDLAGEKLVYGTRHASGPLTRSQRKKAMKDFAGDEISRGTSFTPPRTITIDNKYDGVVTVNVWTGYAVNVVKKDGTRRVVTGPNTVMLDYDETLESFSLSKGTPKSQENKKQDVYLRCTNNRVTDQVRVQTKDLVDVLLTLSYRVNFTGDPSKWFEVDDYVALLTDHMRSVLRNNFQQHGIEDFWADKINMVRDCVLGAQVNGERSGRVFEQNGMSIVDVDFIDAEIQDTQISSLLVDAQHESVRLALDVESSRRNLDSFVELETIKRARADAAEETAKRTAELNVASTQRAHDLAMARLLAENEETERRLRDELDRQAIANEVHESELSRVKAKADLETTVQRERQELRLAELNAKTEAEERRIKAVTPDLIAAMQVMGQSEFAAKITEELSPLAILGGESVAEVAARLLGGLGLDKVLEALPQTPAKRNGNYGKETQVTS